MKLAVDAKKDTVDAIADLWWKREEWKRIIFQPGM